VVAELYEEMKAMRIDGECVGQVRRRCGLLRCTVLYFICDDEGKRDNFTPNVYLRSILATIRAWSLDVYSFAVRERISV
jgi:hypothetical protein